MFEQMLLFVLAAVVTSVISVLVERLANRWFGDDD